MDDQERFPHQRTDLYLAAFELCTRVRAAKIAHAELRDQSERAAISCILAIGEGLPHDGDRMRKQYFARGKASLCELVTATDVARAIGAMAESDWRACQTLALRVRAMLVALLR
jgi:four helix bundle protein